MEYYVYNRHTINVIKLDNVYRRDLINMLVVTKNYTIVYLKKIEIYLPNLIIYYETTIICLSLSFINRTSYIIV